MFKVSDSAYKLYRERKQGIRACCGVLSMDELKEIVADIDLLEYYINTKNTNGVDIDKLIETLT